MELRSRKTPAVNGIPAELLKALGAKGKGQLFDICNETYVNGEWPQEFTESVIVPLEKRQGYKDCVDLRTINLIPHASKIVLKILSQRLETKAELYLGKDQYGFRK